MMLTQEELHSILDYDPETGVFRWKIVPSNTISIGDIAGNLGYQGYITISIKNIKYRAHVLSILYMTGNWPEYDVDHVNGIKSDNRWHNLRLATRGQNMANSGLRRNNRSGIKGVSFDSRYNMWHSRICVNYKTIHLGYFNSKESAIDARKIAEEKYFGEFRYKPT